MWGDQDSCRGTQASQTEALLAGVTCPNDTWQVVARRLNDMVVSWAPGFLRVDFPALRGVGTFPSAALEPPLQKADPLKEGALAAQEHTCSLGPPAFLLPSAGQ